MKKILQLKPVVLFFILTIPWAIFWVIDLGNYDLNMIVGVIAYFIIFLWFLFLDDALRKRVPRKIRPSNTLFLINLILVLITYLFVIIFFSDGKEFHVTGFWALPFSYLFYAWFSIYNHLSKLLTFAEEGKKVDADRRIGEMVLFFFFFIGVWWLQPRIIKVLDKPEIPDEKFTRF